MAGVFVALCSYEDLVAAGFSVAELHLEDRHNQGSSGSDSDSECEFANSDDWETGQPAPAVVKAVTSSSFSSTGTPDVQHGAGSSCSTPKQAAGPQQHLAGSTDGASEGGTDSSSGVATVVFQASASDAAGVQDSSRSKHAAGTIRSKGSQKDLAAAGSVQAAALQVAASKLAAPQSLSLYKLTAEANRNLTGQEKKEKGGLSWLVLNSYVQAAGGFLVALLVLGVMATEQGSRVLTDTFLGWWAADLFKQGLWFYIGIYAGLGVLYSLLTFVR